MASSQVCIVSNPYLVSLDGLPNIDFILDDLRKTKGKKTGVPNNLKKFRREGNLRRLTRIELSAVLNKSSQTKETKKYKQSDSLNAQAYIEQTLIENKKAAQASGIDSNSKSSGVVQHNYLTHGDVDKYLIQPVKTGFTEDEIENHLSRKSEEMIEKQKLIE